MLSLPSRLVGGVVNDTVNGFTQGKSNKELEQEKQHFTLVTFAKDRLHAFIFPELTITEVFPREKKCV